MPWSNTAVTQGVGTPGRRQMPWVGRPAAVQCASSTSPAASCPSTLISSGSCTVLHHSCRAVSAQACPACTACVNLPYTSAAVLCGCGQALSRPAASPTRLLAGPGRTSLMLQKACPAPEMKFYEIMGTRLYIEDHATNDDHWCCD